MPAEPDDQADPDDPEGWAADVDVLLAERAAAASAPGRRAARAAVGEPARRAGRPTRAPWPRGCAARCPLPPNPHARRGTAFHAWLEQRFGAAQLLDVDELPGAADEGAASDDLLEELQEAFLASRWAEREPYEVEVPFETVIDGIAVRGRMDAVYADAGRRLDGRRLEDRRAARSRPPGGAERAARRVPAGVGRAGRMPAGAGAGGVPLRAPRRDAAPRRPARRRRPARVARGRPGGRLTTS